MSEETSYLSVDSFLAHKSAAPLAEDFPVPELGGAVRIQGVTLYAERNAVYAEIAALKAQAAKKTLRVTSPATGETYVPEPGDIVAACWASAAVAAPKLTSFQWLQFCGAGDTILMAIFARCLVCCRLAEDTAAGVPDGEAAAEAELEENPT